MSHHPKMCLSYLLLTDVLRQLWLNGLEHNVSLSPYYITELKLIFDLICTNELVHTRERYLFMESLKAGIYPRTAQPPSGGWWWQLIQQFNLVSILMTTHFSDWNKTDKTCPPFLHPSFNSISLLEMKKINFIILFISITSNINKMYIIHIHRIEENTWSCIYNFYIMTLSTLFSICFFRSGVRKSSNWICFLGFTSWAAFLNIKFVETWRISRTDMEIFNFDVQNAENNSEFTISR